MDSAVVTSTLPGESKGEELKELFEAWRLAVKEALQVGQYVPVEYLHQESQGLAVNGSFPEGKAVLQVCGSAPGVSCVDLQPGAS